MYIPAGLKLWPFAPKEKILIKVEYQIMRYLQALFDIKRKVWNRKNG